MAMVWIPAPMRGLTGGQETVEASGGTVRAVIADLERLHPGLKARLCDGDELRSGLAVVVDGQVVDLGLLASVRPESEVHFLPALSGG